MSVKRIKKIAVGIAVAVNVWAFASWVDVVVANCKPGAVEAAWNMFRLLF